MERWAGHFQELYSTENVVTDKAIKNHTMDEPSTIDEVRKAIDSLSCGKVPGNNALPPEVVKAGRENSLIGHMHELLLQCWEESTIPHDMRDAKIVTLYKNKGDCIDCKNYLGMSLLSIVGKGFAQILPVTF